MYDHILLPVELGGSADLPKALEVAKEMVSEGGKITLLTVLAPIPVHVEPHFLPEIQTQALSHAKRELAMLAAELKLKDTALLQGSVGRSIVEWADENSVHCIVIPSHQPVFSDLFLGSTAAWVVRHAPCCVHVLR